MNASSPLAPLPFHVEIRDYLKREEPDLWKWFSSAQAKEDYAASLRIGLLKSAYRLTRETNPHLYAAAEGAARALGLEMPITLYQAQGPSAPTSNATLHHLRNEAHVVFSGPILSLLSTAELAPIFGHEFAHYLLWSIDNEEFLVADRILHAGAELATASAAHVETARQYRLSTEIYCDRGAAVVTQHLPTVVAALVKISTGLAQVSGESYLAQAAEIFSHEDSRSDGITHPEAFLRAFALEEYIKKGTGADPIVRRLIGREVNLDTLDLVSQVQLASLTRRFIGQLLRPKWFRTEATLSLAKLYFPDFEVVEHSDDTLVNDILGTDSLVKDYFTYVLLDYAAADPSLEEIPVAASLRWADSLGITPAFEKLLTKELGIKAREITKLKPRIADLLTLAEKAP